MATFFFCGIGGIGMSSIALYLKKSGHIIQGSDRSFDQGKNQSIKNLLEQAGITISPQDGSGVSDKVDVFVVSTAVEDSIPDVKIAQKYQLPIRTRPQILSEIFSSKKGIAVAGTSGKTTVTAMVSHILYQQGLSPLMINGGISINTYDNEPASNLIYGTGSWCVIESDESNDSFRLYEPQIAVVNNISLDHMPLPVIQEMFENFLNKATLGIVINADCPHTKQLHLTHPNIISFSALGNETATLFAQHIQFGQNDVSFQVNGHPVRLPLIGMHNVANALSAIATCLHLGISILESVQALKTFLGTKRRLETIGTEKNITVIDDFAHNPEKIKASIQALCLHQGRIFFVFQPHGFGPLKLMKEELIQTLMENLNHDTYWIMNPVFYAGGTVSKEVSSQDIILPLQRANRHALFFETRYETRDFLRKNLKSGDRVVVMGARDDTLSNYALDILSDIKEEKICR